ncbi:MAG: YiiD C-terminal domain-containing protein [Bacteroidia bacterium]|nr:DUF4442 domain-containing protein [Bacteroidia bacterium]MDW8015510.1 YiiD C-terminal domain-containing protein [Bacteroidia bacterium]
MNKLYHWLQKRIRSKTYSPRKLLRLLRLYPPLLFQRIIPLSISDDFLTIHVKVRPSLFTRNLNGTFFGGTLLSAVDMWYGTMLWQKCLREGIPLEVWVERLEMQFIRASRGALYLTCSIPPEQWAEIRQILTTEGKARYEFEFELYDTEGQLCAKGSQILYLRNLALRPRRSNSVQVPS